jgi:hypothetical protein
MRFPFVTRAHHDEMVARLKDQVKGLAMRLYPEGIPEETQLVLGIRVEAKVVVEKERKLTDDEKAIAEMKADQERDRANLARIRRTSPSQLGSVLARYMAKWGTQTAIAASKPSPAMILFAEAEAEALSESPQA